MKNNNRSNFDLAMDEYMNQGTPKRNGETVFIKRYANRKLYNVNSSSYITLESLGELIKNTDVNVQVVDSTTKRDITKSTLLNVMLEMERKKSTTNFTSNELLDMVKEF